MAILRSETGRSSRWLAPGVPIVCSMALAVWASFSAANAVHGYVAAYVTPLVMVGAVLFALVGVAAVVPRRTRRFGVGAIAGGLGMIPAFVGIFNLLDATGQVRWRNQPQVVFGQDVRASLVVYLTAGATNDQINSVWSSVLGDPDPRGKGHRLLPGIQSVSRATPAEGHEAIAVTVRRSATVGEKAAIHQRLAACEFVYKVLENVAPSEVHTLP